MKTLYVCNVTVRNEDENVLKLPSTWPKNDRRTEVEQVDALRANPAFGEGVDELPLPSTFKKEPRS